MKALTKLNHWLLGIYAKLLDKAQETDWWKSYVKERTEAEWRSIREAAYTFFTEDELKLTEGLIDNQVAHMRMSEAANPNAQNFNKSQYLLMAVKAIKNTLMMRNLVGLQPLTSPVGLVYTMRTSKVDGAEPPNDFRLEVRSVAAEAKTRKLQCKWNAEVMHDLERIHGLSVEAEITSAIGHEIAGEFADEIISDLIKLGSTNTYKIEPIVTEDEVLPHYFGDRLAMIGVAVNGVANEIARRTRRGPGNFIVTSPLVISMLQGASKSVFAPAPKDAERGDHSTLMFCGTLNGSIKVYASIRADLGDKILVGYKGGAGEVDTGYIYSQYLPAASSGIVIDPLTFQPLITLMTRYAKTTFEATEQCPVASSDYYGIVDLSELTKLGFV